MGGNTSKQDSLPVAALILAAGESKRFGSPKALARIGNETALACLVRKARESDLSPVVVVIGAEANRIEKKGQTSKCQFVRNPDFTLGQTSSVQEGLKSLSQNIVGGALFVVDQPFVKVETIQMLYEEFNSSPSSIVRPRHEGRGGHPVFLPRRIFQKILKLSLQESLRDLLTVDADIKNIEVADAGVIAQFNTQDEYLALLQTTLDGKRTSRK